MNLKYIKKNITIGQILQNIARDHPHREALVFGEQRITYAQLVEKAERLAVGFSKIGIRKGDHVAIILPNCPEYVFVVSGLALIGAVAVPMSVQLGSQDMQHILSDSESVAAVTISKAYGTDLWSLLENLQSTLPHLKHILLKTDSVDSQNVDVHGDYMTLDSLLANPIPRSSNKLNFDLSVPAMILYTSGTTGKPKGAIHSHRTLLLAIRLVVNKFLEMTNISWKTVILVKKNIKTVKRLPWLIELMLATVNLRQAKLVVLTPFYHMAGYIQLLFVLLTGGKLIIMDRFHPDKAMEMIQKERVTIAFGVPPMFQAMINRPHFNSYDLTSLILILTGAMPVPPRLIRELKEKIGGFIIILYGATEMASGTVTWATDPENKQVETVGRFDSMQGLEIKIVDDERKKVPHGIVGEIAVRAPTLMEGYYKKPEATAGVIDSEGWYYSGDLGMIDEEGYVKVMGRRGDMIIRAGANVYPAEIEHFLLTHPDIDQVAVVGIPGKTGEVIRAYVLPKGGSSLEVGDVTGFCWGQIATYKIPEEIIFVDSLPVTPALMKVQHYKLRDEAMVNNGVEIPE